MATAVRKPLQERSKQSLRRIFAATTDLLSEKTFDEITVTDIAGASGVSVGSVYQRFKTKDDLLFALYEEYLREAEAEFESMAAKNADAPIENRINALIETVSNLFANRRGVVRSLLLKYRRNPDEIPAGFLDRIDGVYAAGMTFLAEGANLRSGSAQIQFAFGLIVTVCREEFIFGDTRRLLKQQKLSPAFKRMLYEAALGVLKPQASAR